MPTDIVMPQMGESIFEGTITKWLKKPGDKVQRDEPLFEISTDKVDAEIPAPAAGVLQEIKVAEGTTVQVNTVVGTIASDGEAPAKAAPKAAAAAPEKKAAPAAPPAAPPPLSPNCSVVAAAQDEDEHARSSPLVRKIAREHNVDLSQVTGTGLGGRITKQDIMAFIEGGASAQGSSAPASAASRRHLAAPAAPNRRSRRHPRRPRSHDQDAPDHRAAHDRIAPHQRSRPLHVRSGHDRIVNLRNKLKSGFEQRNGARLTFMPFFVRAAIIALQQFPIVNASLEGEKAASATTATSTSASRSRSIGD